MVGLVRKGLFGNLALLVLALSLFEQCNCETKGYPLAPSCSKYECPSYEVIESQNDFEIRRYKDAMWVSSPTITSNTYKDGFAIGYSIFFAYFKGYNQESFTINMTAPFLTKIDPSNGFSSYQGFSYLPQDYQNNPPASDAIRTVKLPEQPYAAVRRFPDFMNGTNLPAEVSALKNGLKGTSWEVAIYAKNYIAAAYNMPFELEKVYEIILWFPK